MAYVAVDVHAKPLTSFFCVCHEVVQGPRSLIPARALRQNTHCVNGVFKTGLKHLACSVLAKLFENRLNYYREIADRK